MTFTGIDIGADGGIAVIDGNKLYYRKLGDVLQWTGFMRNFATKDTIVAIEDLHSIYGASAKSNFNFGVNNGIVIGALQSFGYNYFKVPPKSWQKLAWQGIEPVHSDGRVNTKATSFVAAKTLYPNEKFLATPRSTTPHNGIVDAVLLAYYAKLTYKQ